MAILLVVGRQHATSGVQRRMLRVMKHWLDVEKIGINKELRADYTKLNRATLPGQFLEAEERRLSLNLLARNVHGWK
jgi:hypothetical protein